MGTLETYGLKNDGVALVYNDALVPAAAKPRSKPPRRRCFRRDQGRHSVQEIRRVRMQRLDAACADLREPCAMSEPVALPLLRLRNIASALATRLLCRTSISTSKRVRSTSSAARTRGQEYADEHPRGILQADAGEMSLDGAVFDSATRWTLRAPASAWCTSISSSSLR